jgi:hypothetical protein
MGKVNKDDKLNEANIPEEEYSNVLDPEMDLRNICFAPSENKYLNEHYQDNDNSQ